MGKTVLLSDFGGWAATELAQRIASFPSAGLLAIKDRVNEITLAPTGDFRDDSDRFGQQVRNAETQRRIQAALSHGLQTRRAEMDFADIVSDFPT